MKALAALAFLALIPLPADAQEVVTECDRLAASPFDVTAIAPGVKFEEIDAEKAVAACRAAVARDSDDLRLRYQLARALEAQGHDVEALETFIKAADAGYPAAMNGLGRMYKRGGGTAANIDLALLWYGRGALAGDLAAMYNLGEIYGQGLDGVRVDLATAFVWNRMAAEKGYADAQAAVGFAYAVGNGVAVDYDEARAWFEKAAAQGNGVGLFNLGYIYESGTGVGPDAVRAADYYFAAIEAGNSGALDIFAIFGKETLPEVWKAIEARAGVPADGVPDAATVAVLAQLGGFDPGEAVKTFNDAMTATAP